MIKFENSVYINKTNNNINNTGIYKAPFPKVTKHKTNKQQYCENYTRWMYPEGRHR